MSDLRAQVLGAHIERRVDETRAMLATAGSTSTVGRTISPDGLCLRCIRGRLVLLERLPHLARDWARCERCETDQPCAEGVLPC